MTGVPTRYRDIFVISIVVALVSFIPHFGWALSIIAFFFLLSKATNVEFIPDLLLMLIVTVLVHMLLMLALNNLVDRIV